MHNTTPRPRRALFRIVFMVSCLAGSAGETSAQTLSTGMIEGRIFNTASGEYMEFARVTVEGTSHEAFTDSAGQYQIANVPPGAARVTAFYTGALPQTQSVTVAAGQLVQLNFNLAGFHAVSAKKAEGVIKLDQFVVSTSKEMEGAAIAINTQRFAPNIMNVVAADEFGLVAAGNVGEVLKAMPGVSIDIGGLGNSFSVSMDGVPSQYVPVTIGGFNLANAGSITARTVGLQQISLNSFSRIEVLHTPTPETTGSALAGSVNMVPRSAFERSKSIYNFNASLNLRDGDKSFKKTPGPFREPTRKVFPGVEFSAIVPVSSRFGFTLSGSSSSLYTGVEFMNSGWRGTGLATNGGAFPNTTPGNPYLTDYTVRDTSSRSKKSTLGATVDYKLTGNDRLSFSFQWGYSDADAVTHSLLFFVNRVAPGDFTTTSTRGSGNAGELRLVNSASDLGGTVYSPSLTWRHDGPIWHSEVGLGMSCASRYNHDLSKGNFGNTQARRQNVNISFSDIFYLRPRVITVTDASGAPIDPYNLNSYLLNTATIDEYYSVDLQRKIFANVRRDVNWRVPVTLKVGLDVRQSMRDRREETPTYTFVGANGTPNNADDNAAVVLDESFSQRIAPFGFPRIQWVSNQELWELYTANPNYFTVNETQRYTSRVSLSKHAEEVISAAFVRGDVQLMEGRLRLVGGVRAEQTNVKGEGQLIDPTRNFQRDANGRFILGANGRPLSITTNALETARLTNIDRGLHAEKEYFRLFPSLNASYNLRENLVARAGYYWSVGRPDYSQYAGSLTLPDVELPNGPGNRIAVNNAGIKTWQAKTIKLSLEYYFEKIGLISIGGYQRDFKNFFGSTVLRATPGFLSLYGLDPAIYDDYDVSTEHNIPSPVRMTGLTFNYKQPLTFLPHWARGVQVFANASAQRATGDVSDNFANFVPRSGNWGISLTRPKYNLQMRWNYKGRNRGGAVAAGQSIEPGTFNWRSKKLLIDVSGEYYFYKAFAVFANMNNINDQPTDFEIAGPSTPPQAQLRQRQASGSLWMFGIKGTF